MATLVVFEPGRALLGDLLVPLSSAGSRGELRVGGASGPLLRPLTFGERTRIVARVAGAPGAVEHICAAILDAAMVEDGELDRRVAEVLALALAGADAPEPPFMAAVQRLAQAFGWDLRQINEAEAVEIDRLALHLGGAALADDGWSRIVFVEAPPASLAGVREQLALQLLARAATAPDEAVSPAEAVPALRSAWPSSLTDPGPGAQTLAQRNRAGEAGLAGLPAAGPGPKGLVAPTGELLVPIDAPATSLPAPQELTPAALGGAGAASPSSPERQTGPQASGQRRGEQAGASREIQPQRLSFRLRPGAAERPQAARAGRAQVSAPTGPPASTTGALTPGGASWPQAPRAELRGRGAVPTSGLALPGPAAPALVERGTEPPLLPPFEERAPAVPSPARPSTAEPSAPAALEQLAADELADALAALLDHEADLRGIDL